MHKKGRGENPQQIVLAVLHVSVRSCVRACVPRVRAGVLWLCENLVFSPEIYWIHF